MIYHCDALLEAPQRYASLKFRRYSRWFRPTRLAWDEAVELVAFVETVGLEGSTWIFHWGQAGVGAYTRLARHVGKVSQIEANTASVGLDDGLAVLRAMLDGGWREGQLPKVVRMALGELYHRGMTYAAIGRYVGLTREQVRNALYSRPVSDWASNYAQLGF